MADRIEMHGIQIHPGNPLTLTPAVLDIGPVPRGKAIRLVFERPPELDGYELEAFFFNREKSMKLHIKDNLLDLLPSWVKLSKIYMVLNFTKDGDRQTSETLKISLGEPPEKKEFTDRLDALSQCAWYGRAMTDPDTGEVIIKNIYGLEIVRFVAGVDHTARSMAEAAQDAVETESEIRQEADGGIHTEISGIKTSFDAWIGRGGYLSAHDFGTAVPSQEDLTNYAMAEIGITDPAEIWNGTKIKNLHDNHTWIMTNTPDTDPPIHEWTDQGVEELVPFSTGLGGYIVGGNEETDPPGTVIALPGGKGKLSRFEEAVINAVHPVGSQYVQYPSAASNDFNTAFPEVERPEHLFGGTWQALWESENVFFRTGGTSGSAAERTNGLQGQAYSSHTHTAVRSQRKDGRPDAWGDVGQGGGYWFDGHAGTPGLNYNVTSSGGTETRPKNRFFIIWKRTA